MNMSDLPATKQDLADAVRQLNEKFSRELAETRIEFRKDLQETTDKLTEAIRDSQTEVLRAFYDWARPVDMRLRHADELVQRMGWLEERMAQLERGKPPSTH
jgi:gas vesicle protein